MFTLSVTAEEITILGEALDEMPFKKVSGLVEKLRKQIANQQQPDTKIATPPANMGVVDTRVEAVPVDEVQVEAAA